MTLVILAAGMGSRYGGLKQLDPMTDHGEVILDFSVFDAMRAGFDRVVFIIKEENLELFRETVGARIENGSGGKLKVEYAFQSPDRGIPEGCTVPEVRLQPGARPLGTGHALLCAEEVVGGDCFAVINADDFYGEDTFARLSAFLKEHKNAGEVPGGENAGDENRFAMAGFILEKTLTENGSVSRGVCEVEENGYLRSIHERTKIYRTEGGQTVFEEDGKQYPVDPRSAVSMNCWAFTSGVFDILREGFADFLRDAGEGKLDPVKGEFYLPMCVSEGMQKGRCTVQVLRTTSDWYGVTYPEDKAAVKESLRRLTQSGSYPDGLWG